MHYYILINRYITQVILLVSRYLCTDIFKEKEKLTGGLSISFLEIITYQRDPELSSGWLLKF